MTLLLGLLLAAAPPPDYEDRARAVWTAQVIAANLGFAFEHKPASVETVTRLPDNWPGYAPVDDDYYYEIVALRAFEKYGPRMTIRDLGRQWRQDNAGSWGSSEQTRLLLAKGIEPPDTGHPRYNKLWFTIGPQFSADIYGLLAPGRPRLAAALAREYGHINGYAEAVDGAVFVAGMVSVAFVETDPQQIVRRAAQLIPPESPYRQCIDLVIRLAESGKTAKEVAQAVEDRWHIEYPATNNAVANGGIVALSVWFGEGDFLKTINAAMAAADYTDADCNAANAASVVGALRGMKGLPDALVAQLGDHIRGDKMGPVTFASPVDESLADLARRTVKAGAQILQLPDPPLASPELFTLADLTKYWNPAWRLDRAGFGGGGGGMALRGMTYLDGEVLATWPRDEVRGALLTSETDLTKARSLHLEVAADSGRAWRLEIYAGNRRLFSEVVDTSWRSLDVPLPAAGPHTTLRLYQLVLVPGRLAGSAYWRNLRSAPLAGGGSLSPAPEPVLIPQIDGEWWTIAGNPDLGKYTTAKQEPVDFAIWQAADGTWQLWSCIRHTAFPGGTRLFHRWQGTALTSRDWDPVGIALQTDPAFGEEIGMTQAPFVMKIDGEYWMFYGGGSQVCLAKGVDGKTFARQLMPSGKSALFSDGPGSLTRDVMVLKIGDLYHAYYTTSIDKKGADFVRTSKDLLRWSPTRIVAAGGSAGDGPWSAECPFVYYHRESGYYYLFRTQRYRDPPQTSVYRSKDPLDFGVNDDRNRVAAMVVAAPELIEHGGQLYMAALLPELNGIRIARLKWVPKN